jgi:hypothetical protein
MLLILAPSQLHGENINPKKEGNETYLYGRQGNHCARKTSYPWKKIYYFYASGRLRLECFFLQPHCMFVYTEKLASPEIYAAAHSGKKDVSLTKANFYGTGVALTPHELQRFS